MREEYILKTERDYDWARDVIRIVNSPKTKYRVGIIQGVTCNGKKQPDKLIIEWIEAKQWK